MSSDCPYRSAGAEAVVLPAVLIPTLYLTVRLVRKEVWLLLDVAEEATSPPYLYTLVQVTIVIRMKASICKPATSRFRRSFEVIKSLPPFIYGTLALICSFLSRPQSLWASCADLTSAAKAAMAVLKAGGTAVDAVEMAIKVLEDREITNAGYGGNLTMEGHVECDATIVDHYGRSGAVGAMSRQSQL